MAFSYSALKDLLAEDGRDDLIDQVDNSTVLVDWKMAEGGAKNSAKVFEVMRLAEEVGRVQIDNSGYANQGFQVDGGTRRAAKQLTYASGTYGFTILSGDAEFPEGITRVARGVYGIDLYQQAMQKAGAQMSRLSERALINHELAATENSESLGSSVTVEVDDVSGFRPGMICDIYASDGTTVRQLNAEISSITDDGDGSGAIVIVSLTSNLSAGDRLFIAGAGGDSAPTSGLRCVNIADMSDSAVALYSGLAVGDQPSGILDSSTTAWSNAAGKRMIQRIFTQCGESPTHILVHPYQMQKIYESQNPNLRFANGDTMDTYGPRMKFDSCDVVQTNTQKPKRADFLNARPYVSKLHVFWEPSPSVDGGKNGGWSRESLQLSQVNFSWKLFLSCGINLRVPRRNAHGSMSNLNAAF